MTRWLALPILALLTPVQGRPPAALDLDAPIVCRNCAAWNAPRRPFRVFGNTYFVGTAGLSSLLLASDQGLVLIDGALPQSAPLIAANIRALGFRSADVKLILTSHAHFDHVGGVAALQRFTGASVVGSAASARALTLGHPTPDDPQVAEDPAAFPAVANVRAVADGERVRLGSVAITAQLTPGHTPGATSWTWQSCEGARCLNIVYADSLTAVSAPGFRFTGGPSQASLVESFRQSIAKVGELPCDVLITTHPAASGLDEKLKRRASGEAPDPFVDTGACRAYAAGAMKGLQERVEAEHKQ